MNLAMKRVYEEPSPDDGYRILVDRLWPRGVKKERADLDLWMKGIAPSPELRKWFGHDPARFKEFSERYRQELDNDTEAVDELLDIMRSHDKVTLVYAAKDPSINHVVVLRDYMDHLAGQSAA